MNVFPTFSRASAHHTLPLRSISHRPLQPRQQLRQLSSTTSLPAQPIELTSSTTPASPTESSTLSSTILSRASTDPSPPPLSSPSSESPFLLTGTITRTGRMSKTVHLTTHRQVFDKFLQKHYTRPSRVLAHDPHVPGYLREGDVVEYGLFSETEKALREEKRLSIQDTLVQRGVIRLKTRKGKERDLKTFGVRKGKVRWVVRRVVTPFGVGVEERAKQEEEVLRRSEVVEGQGQVRNVKAAKTRKAGGAGGRKGVRDLAVAV